MPKGLAGRLILLGMLCACLIALAGGWLLRSGLQSAMRHGFEQRLAERADMLVARFSPASSRHPDNAPLAYAEPRSGDEFGRIFSGWYWRLTGEGLALRSRSLWDADVTDVRAVGTRRLTAGNPQGPALARHSREGGNPASLISNETKSLGSRLRGNDGNFSTLLARGPRGEALMGIAQDVTLAERPLRLEVYGPADPVLAELRAFDRLLAMIFAFLLLAMALTAVIQARVGLRPLARLREALARAKDGTRERLGGGYGPDLDPLAAELDDLLARNARIVARARSHAADLAHALKKPLALLRSDADADASVPSPQVRSQVRDMTRLIDRHLARAGSGAGERRRIAVAQHLADLLALMRQLHAARDIHWEMRVPARLHWRGEATDFEEMLGNLMDNAGKWAASRVRVAAGIEAGEVVIDIDDDGPGLSEAQLARAARRGQRFDESVEGNGLGLAITADIAETYEGRLELSRGGLGGLRARLVLPA